MKKFLMTVAFVATFAVAGSASAATYVYSGGLLKVGSQGTQVYNLQECLARLGNNPSSNIDGKFGPITKAAVMSFQASQGVMVDGIIGSVTGPRYTVACAGGNSSMNLPEGCTSTVGYSPVTAAKCDGSDSSNNDASNFDANDGEEVNFTGLDIDDASDTTIDEGSNKAELASMQFKNEDSDVLLERFDTILVSDIANGNYSAADEKDAWKTFDKLYLYVDGEMVASKDADNKADWEDRTVAYNTEDSDNRFRFTGINKVLAKNEDHEIVVKADIASSVDMDLNGSQWALVLDPTTMRFVDEAGITQYLSEADTNNETTAKFAIVSAGNQDELQIKSSDNNPDSTTFEVKSGQDSDEEMLFAFDAEADQDGGDLEVSQIQLTADTGVANFDDVVSKVTLKIDGEEEDYDVAKTTAIQALNTNGPVKLVFDFDGKEININSGDTKTAEVYVTFKSTNNQTAYLNGETIKFSVTATDVDAWDVDGADTLTTAQLTGSAVGDVHQLSEEGVIATLDSSSVTTNIDNNGEVKTATYTMNVDVKAFGDTFYVGKVAQNAATISGQGALAFDVEDSADAAVPSSSVSFALASSAQTDGIGFRIDEGQTETLTLTATVEIAAAGTDTYTRIQLNQLGAWTDNALTAGGQVIALLPVEDFESDLQLINNI